MWVGLPQLEDLILILKNFKITYIDGLTNTALKKEDQGFQATADRQTFRGGDGWFDASAGDLTTRREFDALMLKLRNDLSLQLNRPTLATDAPNNKKHEMTYNWYQPGASLGRHLDEHHEETKGNKGWLLPTRRSVTWLVYLNDAWQPEEGGSLQTFPRQPLAQFPVGAHEGNLQVGWMDQVHPVFLDAWRPSGGTALYMLDDHNQPIYISQHDFDVPRQPIEFEQLLSKVYSGRFEQISTARLDPRFVNKDNHNQPISPNNKEDEPLFALNILPTGGTLVLFDSVSLPHLVQAVTGNRPRIAATGWFHEDNSQFPAERIE